MTAKDIINEFVDIHGAVTDFNCSTIMFQKGVKQGLYLAPSTYSRIFRKMLSDGELKPLRIDHIKNYYRWVFYEN